MKRCTQTPNQQTIAAAATWPPSFSHQRRPRKSSTAPTVVATAAPSRMPRIWLSSCEERERRDEDPEEEREPAEPRHAARRLAASVLGPVDDAEQARHAADGRGQEHDDHEGDQRRPRRTSQVVRELVPDHRCDLYFVP